MGWRELLGWGVLKVCARCEGIYFVTKGQSKFCSVACRQSQYREANREKYRETNRKHSKRHGALYKSGRVVRAGYPSDGGEPTPIEERAGILPPLSWSDLLLEWSTDPLMGANHDCGQQEMSWRTYRGKK